MKKITLFFVFAILGAFTFSSYAQTLNQPATWPNATWTLTGSYTAAGLTGDPTLNATFGFDDDAAGNGSADTLQATSPVIDLTAANTAGEIWVTISGDYLYRELGGDILNIEVYDADAATWSQVLAFTNNNGDTGYQTCATPVSYTTVAIDISGYTATQLSGFQYRFTYNDQAGWQWGYCLTSPTIASATPPTCIDPSALSVSNITATAADLAWTENGTATLWNVELVDITGAGAPTGTPTATGVTNPYNQTGLASSNAYEFYVQADCGAGTGGLSNWVGPFAFTTAVACPAPSALYANVLVNTVDLGWTENGTATLWDVELVDITAGGTATGTPSIPGVTNPFTYAGLAVDNDYAYYVRADCGVDGTSSWTGPFAFRTACTVFTAPYSEDFENASALPACWSLGGDENWTFNTAGPNHVGNNGTLSGSTASGGYYAVVDDSTPDATDAQLNSPFIDVSGLTVPALIFYEISNNEGNPNATLTVTVWDGAAWNSVGVYNTNTVAGGWEQKVVDLSGLTFTGPAQVRFSIADSGSFYDDIAIDDVQLLELPACTDPSALTATNITDNSADLGWTETGTATLWNVELVDVTAAGTATGIATASGVTNPYSQTGLVENNNYEFYVQADCATNGTSNWVGPFAFTSAETCPTPSALTATTITETTADFGWTENGVATLWNIELVDLTAGGTATGTPTTSGVATNPYTQTGLVGDNTYQYYVQADCGVDGTSFWAGPFTFATPYVAVPPDCTNGLFVDSGGQSGDYTSGENITYTITPTPGENVTVDFAAFSTENNGTGCYDGLTIHDGPDNTAATINPPAGGTIWCWDRDDAVPAGSGDLQGMTITSTHATGALTFVFTSDGSVNREGWIASVNCATLSTIDFANGSIFKYYPNPVDNTLTLNAQKEISNVAVFNMLGQEVIRTAPNAVSNTVDMANLHAGAYFVRVTVGNAVQTVRIIKN